MAKEPDKIQSSWEEKVTGFNELIGSRQATRAELAGYYLEGEPFEEGVNHGMLHHARELVLVDYLFGILVGSGEVNFDRDENIFREVLRRTAVIHDRFRQQKDDPDHGDRAAEWAGENLRGELDPVCLSLTQYLCKFHVLTDANMPTLPKKLLDLVNIFKDGDAEDRGRFNDDDGLDQSMLRFGVSRDLVEVADEFIKRTSREYGSDEEVFNGVLDTAVEMELIRP